MALLGPLLSPRGAMLALAGQQTRSFSRFCRPFWRNGFPAPAGVGFLAAFHPRQRATHMRPHRVTDALRLSGPCKPAT